MIKFQCPTCANRIFFNDDNLMGSEYTCEKCGDTCKVPHQLIVTDHHFIQTFKKINCRVRYALIKRLSRDFEIANPEMKFCIAVGMLEQYIALLEDILMLLYAMKSKKENPDASLFYYYKRTFIREGQDPSCQSTEKMITILKSAKTNLEFSNIFGINLEKSNLDINGDEIKNVFDVIINIMSTRKELIPLADSYNAIKHGLTLDMRTSDVGISPQIIHTRFFLCVFKENSKESRVNYTGIKVHRELIDLLINRADVMSKYFDLFWTFVDLTYVT